MHHVHTHTHTHTHTHMQGFITVLDVLHINAPPQQAVPIFNMLVDAARVCSTLVCGMLSF